MQLALLPPLAPAHVHVQGPAPLTAVAVPVAHSPAVGATSVSPPFAVPQAPLTTSRQLAPETFQLPWLHVAVAEPTWPPAVFERPALKPWACAACEAEQPGDQLSVVAAQLRLPLQLTLAPPNAPSHDQVQGPLPLTALAVPLAHRLLVGAVIELAPFAAPQPPMTTVLQLVLLKVQTPSPLAEHVAVAPPEYPTTALPTAWVTVRLASVVVPLQLPQARLVAAQVR